MDSTTATNIGLARDLFRVLETEDGSLAQRVVASNFYNPTAVNSPAASRNAGPAGVLASSAWLRFAFPDLSFFVEDAAATQDAAWLRLRMRGTHTGPFVRFDGNRVAQVIPPTGQQIDAEQVHFISIHDGQIVRHDALRDDLAMLGQMGVFPPGPKAAAMAWWKLTGRAHRAAEDVSRLADAAAATIPSGS